MEEAKQLLEANQDLQSKITVYLQQLQRADGLLEGRIKVLTRALRVVEGARVQPTRHALRSFSTASRPGAGYPLSRPARSPYFLDGVSVPADNAEAVEQRKMRTYALDEQFRPWGKEELRTQRAVMAAAKGYYDSYQAWASTAPADAVERHAQPASTAEAGAAAAAAAAAAAVPSTPTGEIAATRRAAPSSTPALAPTPIAIPTEGTATPAPTPPSLPPLLAAHLPSTDVRTEEQLRAFVTAVNELPAPVLESAPELVDWLALVQEFVTRRTVEECRRRWTLLESPQVNSGRWSAEEDHALRLAVTGRSPGQWEKVAQALGTARTALECMVRYRAKIFPSFAGGRWKAAEDAELMRALQSHGDHNWPTVSLCVGARNPSQCVLRFTKMQETASGLPVRRSPWTKAEDVRLALAVKRATSLFVPGRSGTQCRERWVDLLAPGYEQGLFTAEEDQALTRLVRAHGNQWTRVAREMADLGFKRRGVQWKRRFFDLHSSERLPYAQLQQTLGKEVASAALQSSAADEAASGARVSVSAVAPSAAASATSSASAASVSLPPSAAGAASTGLAVPTATAASGIASGGPAAWPVPSLAPNDEVHLSLELLRVNLPQVSDLASRWAACVDECISLAEQSAGVAVRAGGGEGGTDGVAAGKAVALLNHTASSHVVRELYGLQCALARALERIVAAFGAVAGAGSGDAEPRSTRASASAAAASGAGARRAPASARSAASRHTEAAEAVVAAAELDVLRELHQRAEERRGVGRRAEQAGQQGVCVAVVAEAGTVGAAGRPGVTGADDANEGWDGENADEDGDGDDGDDSSRPPPLKRRRVFARSAITDAHLAQRLLRPRVSGEMIASALETKRRPLHRRRRERPSTSAAEASVSAGRASASAVERLARVALLRQILASVQELQAAVRAVLVLVAKAQAWQQQQEQQQPQTAVLDEGDSPPPPPPTSPTVAQQSQRSTGRSRAVAASRGPGASAEPGHAVARPPRGHAAGVPHQPDRFVRASVWDIATTLGVECHLLRLLDPWIEFHAPPVEASAGVEAGAGAPDARKVLSEELRPIVRALAQITAPTRGANESAAGSRLDSS